MAEEQVLAATQTTGEAGKKWFQGTADAVRQFIWMFEVRAQNFAFYRRLELASVNLTKCVSLVYSGCEEQERGTCIDLVR